MYFLRLFVSDGEHQKTADVTITVDPPAGPNNLPPVADAGISRTVLVGSGIQILDGTGTTDDGFLDSLTYQWQTLQRPFGAPEVTQNTFVLNPTAPQALFDPRVPGFYQFELTVSDGEFESAATVDIAPTLAKRLGIETPDDLDGRVLPLGDTVLRD